MTKKELELLADALGDVGCWSWWEERFPRLLQLEFVGTELYLGQSQAGQPPDSQLALSFVKPVSVSFLNRKDPPSPPRQAGSRRASFCPGV